MISKPCFVRVWNQLIIISGFSLRLWSLILAIIHLNIPEIKYSAQKSNMILNTATLFEVLSPGHAYLMHMNWLTSVWWMQAWVQCSGRLGKSATAMVCSLEWTKQDLCGLLAKGKLATTHYCLVHVVTFTFISILVPDYIQKREGQTLLFSFEYNLLPNLILK